MIVFPKILIIFCFVNNIHLTFYYEKDFGFHVRICDDCVQLCAKQYQIK